MSLLEVKNLSHTFGDKLLYKNTGFDLFHGEHMGLVGQNGTGKSTLIKILTGEVIPDAGNIKWHPKMKVGHLDQYASVDQNQTIGSYLRSAFAELFELDQKLDEANRLLAESGDELHLRRALSYQETLDRNDFHLVGSKIQKVADGLGITPLGLDRPLSQLSDGQRAKVILAKLLLGQPNLLLMDEPTNFLDKEHVDWLAKYLRGFRGAFVIVSHDFEFLDRITTCILDLEFESLKKYGGNYSTFLKQKGQKREEYIRQYESQQKLIARTEDYIARNKARASTAAMAKSRQKKLDKMDRLPPPSVAGRPSFCFESVSVTSQNALEVQQLEIGYYYPLLPKLDFQIKNGEKAVVTGFNGIGKSTLMKTLVGELPALSGQFRFAPGTAIGYFQQDFVWADTAETPMQVIGNAFPRLTQKQVRKALAQCGLKAELAMQSVGTLSGGEQAKVKLCRLTLAPHSFLLLDEPTNHLDAEAKEELQKAVSTFNGTVILVSHEASFYRDWADRIIDIEQYVKY